MVQSKGWDWENANQSAWLNPYGGQLLSVAGMERKGLQQASRSGNRAGPPCGSFCKEWRNIVHWICITDINVCIIM